MQPSRSNPLLSISQNTLRPHTPVLETLLDRSSLRAGDLVLDLGAGTGNLTAHLVERGCRVWAVELDPQRAARLSCRFAGHPNVRVCAANILELKLPRQPYKVFANIPFNVTTAIIQRLTQCTCPPTDAYLVVQREAAERFVGRPRPTLVAVLLRPRFEATIVHHFRRTDFWPVPRVDVAMLRLQLEQRGPPPERVELFRDFVVRLYTARDGALGDALARLVGRRRARRIAAQCRLDADVRPTALAVADWLELFAAFERGAPAQAPWLLAGAERRLRAQQRRLRKVHRTRTPGRRLGWSPHPGSVGDCRPPPRLARAQAARRGRRSPSGRSRAPIRPASSGRTASSAPCRHLWRRTGPGRRPGGAHAPSGAPRRARRCQCWPWPRPGGPQLERRPGLIRPAWR